MRDPPCEEKEGGLGVEFEEEKVGFVVVVGFDDCVDVGRVAGLAVGRCSLQGGPVRWGALRVVEIFDERCS